MLFAFLSFFFSRFDNCCYLSLYLHILYSKCKDLSIDYNRYTWLYWLVKMNEPGRYIKFHGQDRKIISVFIICHLLFAINSYNYYHFKNVFTMSSFRKESLTLIIWIAQSYRRKDLNEWCWIVLVIVREYCQFPTMQDCI